MTRGRRDPRLGLWATLGEARLTGELIGSSLGWIGIDQQHGHFDDRALREALAGPTAGRAAGGTLGRPGGGTVGDAARAPVLVRVAANDQALIGRALDSGADGVVVPLVNTVGEARAAAAACRYPPHGSRSWGPLHGAVRAHSPGNDGGKPAVPLCSVMIETASALDAVEHIAMVPGVDMVFVGPFDLSLGLGLDLDGMIAAEGESAPLSRVTAACRAAGVLAGAYAGTPERASDLARRGFTWIAATTDTSLLGLGVEALRDRVLGGGTQPSQDARRAGNAAS